jgi:hypothetical protein
MRGLRTNRSLAVAALCQSSRFDVVYAVCFRRASSDPAAASISPRPPRPAVPSAGTVVAPRKELPNRSCAIANPPAALGAVITTLVMGVELDAAMSNAPLNAIVRVTVPTVDAPFKNVAVILKGLPATFAGSSSNPNVVAGLLSVKVNVVVAESVSSKRGVLLSVFGGAPQKFHPAPIDAAVNEGVKVTVCPDAVSDDTVLKLAATIGSTVVLPVYCAVGVEIVMNCAEAGSAAASPIHNKLRKLRIFRET